MEIARNRKISAAGLAAIFGLILSVSLYALEPSLRTLSPFAATGIVIASGMVFTVFANVRELWRTDSLTRAFFLQAGIVGLFVFLSVLSFVLGLSLGAHPFVALLLLTTSPLISLLGRKIFWGETMSVRARIGIVVAALGWFLLIFKTQHANVDLVSLGNGMVFLGAFLWGTAMTLTRPQQYGSDVTVFWSWVTIFSGLVGIPVLVVFNRILLSLPRGTVGSRSIPTNFTELWPLLLFGAAAIFVRLVFLSRSNKAIGSSKTAFMWVFAVVVFGAACSCLQSQWVLSLSQSIGCGLHLFGLVTSRIFDGVKGPGRGTALTQVDPQDLTDGIGGENVEEPLRDFS